MAPVRGLIGLSLLGVAMLVGCAKKEVTASNESPSKTNAGSAEKSKANDQDPASGRGSNDRKKARFAARPILATEFPKPDGATKPMYEPSTSTLMFRCENDTAKMLKFYEEKLGALGWKKDEANSEIIDGAAFTEFKSGDLKITLTMNPHRDGKTMMTFASGTGIDVPEELGEMDDDDE